MFTTNAAAGTNSGGSGGFYLDLEAGTARQLWTGAQSQSRTTGLVTDGATLYGAAGLRETRWSYGAIGAAPTEIDRYYRRGADGIVYGTAFANLTTLSPENIATGIYGYTNFNTVGGTQVEDGIYRIDPTAMGINVVDTTLIWRHDDRAYNFEGLAYNSANGLFYATNNPASNAPTGAAAAGIYTIDAFGSGAVTKLFDYGTFLPGATGLTFGGGKLWVSGKATGASVYRIASLDLTTGTYSDLTEISGFTTAVQKTALVWAPGAPVPEPATLVALGFGALALLRRRRARV